MDELGNIISNVMEKMGVIDSPGLSPDVADSLSRKTCCANLYQWEPVRLLLGDVLHPGGLALTHRLGKLVNIQPDDLVLDVACGRGGSAMAVARSFHCRVVGADLSREGIAAAARQAKGSKMDGHVSFLCADGEMLPFSGTTFDAVLCECSMSLFPDKRQGVTEITRLLSKGGRLGVSDVTLEPGCLPDELKGVLGQILCLADAPSVDGYRELINADGLVLTHSEDEPDSIFKLLEDIESKLAALRFLSTLQSQSADGPDVISLALGLVDKVKTLVRQGGIGYWLFVAEKTRKS